MQNQANPKACPPRKQRGNALLIFFLLVAMGMLSLLVSKLASQPGLPLPQTETTKELAEAKEVLMGIIVSQLGSDGRLPAALITPDNWQTRRLDYATYGLTPAREPTSPLWYASSGYPLFDIDNRHWLRLCNGNSPSIDELALVIIAPGQALASQVNRNASNPNDNVNFYLEGIAGATTDCTAPLNNASNNGVLIAASATSTFNDHPIAISKKDITDRLARWIANDLDSHAITNGEYPAPAADFGNCSSPGALLPYGPGCALTATAPWLNGSSNMYANIRYIQISDTEVELSFGTCPAPLPAAPPATYQYTLYRLEWQNSRTEISTSIRTCP
ncbi:hypothetical protein [Chitinimonas sp. JJ19]|uniref:hypothetical protein n=1 Tax=Chitinimonas sp. JJ19 TaxID=3109352 RepID=UPI001A4BD96D|nr:hypothetical protein [Chitinimonas sp.]